MFIAESNATRLDELTLQSLKKKIVKHYYNEIKIMSEMIDGHYSREEMDDLQRFMLNHAYVKFADQLCKRARQLNPSVP